MRTFSRVINLGWFMGLFYYQAIATYLFLLRRIKMAFQIRQAMLVFALSGVFFLIGMGAALLLMRRKKKDRDENLLFLASIILYLCGFCGAFIARVPLALIACMGLCTGVLGFDAAFVNRSVSGALRLDRYAGRIVGLAVLFLGALMAATTLFRAELAFFILGFLLLVYFYCRPPKKHLFIRNRPLRKELNIIATKRAVLNYHSMVAVLGIRASASICLAVPIYNTENLIHTFCLAAAFCGLGAFAAGFPRDRLTRYLPVLPFCAASLALVSQSFFGVITSQFAGIAINNLLSGALLLYYICVGTDFPIEERPPWMINKALMTFALSAGIGVAVMSQIVMLANGRAAVITVSTLSIVLILMQLFFDSIYQSHEKPRIPLEVRLQMFGGEHAFTARENEVAAMVLTSEKSLKEVANELYISPSTLEKHMTSIYDKTHTKNRSELTHKFFMNNADNKKEDG